VVYQGEKLLTPEQARQLAIRLMQGTDARVWAPILCNQVPTASWAAGFPQIRNLIAFQVAGKRPLGWLIVLNKKGQAPFRRSDAALLLPFAGLLELLLRWSGRHQDLKDLLV